MVTHNGQTTIKIWLALDRRRCRPGWWLTSPAWRFVVVSWQNFPPSSLSSFKKLSFSFSFILPKFLRILFRLRRWRASFLVWTTFWRLSVQKRQPVFIIEYFVSCLKNVFALLFVTFANLARLRPTTTMTMTIRVASRDERTNDFEMNWKWN